MTASGPLNGVRVVELGAWVAGPSAGGILSDWGADVIKVEPPNGDPFRGFYVPYTGSLENPPFELDNRGKRSLAVDLGHEQGQRIVRELIADADVFVSNLRLKALERWGLGYDELAELNPRLIYAQITGYGEEGPDRDRASYDIGAFWARTGVASLLSDPDQPPVQQRGGMGDHTTGVTTAAGIAAALYARERSGAGQRVSSSLLRTGLYFVGWDVSEALRWGPPTFRVMPERRKFPNPLIMTYRDSAGKWMWLLGLEPDRHWKKVCAAVGREDWAKDAGLETASARAERCTEIIDYLDEVFATRTREEWHHVFAEHDVWWSPVLTPYEATQDEAIQAAGAFVDTTTADGRSVRQLANPVEFSHTPIAVPGPTAELGEHTEFILLELGYSWDQIAELKDTGAVP